MKGAKKGERRSPSAEIKKGQHFSVATEIKKGQHLSPATEFKKGQSPFPDTQFKKGHQSVAGFKKGHISSPKCYKFPKGHIPPNRKERPLKTTLESLYLNQKLTITGIASIYQVCDWTVRNWLKVYEIPVRNNSEAQSIRQQKLEERRKASETSLRIFRNSPELIKRCLPQKPNKKEKALDLFIQTHFPNEWKYVGNGEVNLGERYPDWININGKKQVIELFGAYWHDPFINPKIGFRKTEVATYYHYNQYGFRCLVIWQRELKKPRKLLKKIKEFNNG